MRHNAPDGGVVLHAAVAEVLLQERVGVREDLGELCRRYVLGHLRLSGGNWNSKNRLVVEARGLPILTSSKELRAYAHTHDGGFPEGALPPPISDVHKKLGEECMKSRPDRHCSLLGVNMHQRAPPRSAAAEEPHLTYDEASTQRSRHFSVALQELKNLRPQLYSAAEYFESSYHYSDQKQVVLDNLKDYSVKALVNAVDHLGTVAYKLNDLLAQENSELETTQTRSDSLTQRLRACQEHSDREGMKQQSLIRTCPRNYSHYVLVDPLAEEKAQTSGENFSQAFNPEQLHPVQAEQSPAVVNGSKSLLWHLSSDTTPSSQGSWVSRTSYSSNGRPESAIARDSFLSLPSDLDSTRNPSPASISPSALNQPKNDRRTPPLTTTTSSNSTPGRNVTAEAQVAPADIGSTEQPHASSRNFLSDILGRRAKQGIPA